MSDFKKDNRDKKTTQFEFLIKSTEINLVNDQLLEANQVELLSRLKFVIKLLLNYIYLLYEI